MNSFNRQWYNRACACLVLASVLAGSAAPAAIDGITNTVINLTAKSGHITTPDGNSILIWGYANEAGLAQYPGPTFIWKQGDTVQITLNNQLPERTSMLFPGQKDVAASGGIPGLLTSEAETNGGTVTYTFTASQAGTYAYNSGSRADVQVEMGLSGAIVIRPAMSSAQAYNHVSTAFDVEYLFVLSEMDPVVHDLIEQGRMAEVDTTTFFPVYWFINGRCGPDTLSESYASWLPSQPYNSTPMMYPGQKLLMRMVGGGRDPHPFHFHGNNALTIAREGRMLESVPGASGPDLAESDFTITTYPGATADAIFTWTGEKLGWDMYGHEPGDPLMPDEYAPDHGKPFPVTLPNDQQLTYGQHYGGSPFLGMSAPLPPNNGGFNADGAFMYMWHSHNEKEIVNNDIFPGGMMTMLMIMPRM